MSNPPKFLKQRIPFPKPENLKYSASHNLSDNQTALRAYQTNEFLKKLDALFQHYSAGPISESSAFLVLLKVIEDFVPGFSFANSPGRQIEWDDAKGIEFMSFVRLLCQSQGITAYQACKRISKFRIFGDSNQDSLYARYKEFALQWPQDRVIRKNKLEGNS